MLTTLRAAPRQIRRNFTDLPWEFSAFGPTLVVHLLTVFLFIMYIFGAYGGMRALVLFTVIGGGMIAALFMILAYGRAMAFDNDRRRKLSEGLLKAWLFTRAAPPDRKTRIGFRVITRDGTPRLHVWRDNPPFMPDVPDSLRVRIEKIFTPETGCRRLRRSSRLTDRQTVRADLAFTRSRSPFMLATLRTAPRHIRRGLTSLPRLGSHPGNFLFPLLVVLAGSGAGAIGGPDAAMAFAFAAIVILAPRASRRCL